MQKVLITGGTGFLGSHLTNKIINEVESITIVTTSIRQETSFKKLVNYQGDNACKINLVVGDVRNFDFLRLLFNEYEFDTVFHLAAISEVVKYLLKLDVTNLGHKSLRKIVVTSMNEHEEFKLQFEDLPPRAFYVTKHEVKIETKIHS